MAIAFVRNSGTKVGKATTGGELEVTVTAGAVGNRWIAAISYAKAHTGLSISDAAGNSWKEDAWEENSGMVVTIFSAVLKSASTTAFKIAGLGSETACEVSVAEFSGIQQSGAYVRGTSGTKGEGKEPNSGSTFGNAKTSDLVFGAMSSNTNSTFTARGGYTATTTAAQAGGTVAGAWLLSPPATTEPEGTFSVSGKWAGELAIYRSVNVVEPLQASLSPAAGTFLLGSEPLSEFTGTETSSAGELEAYAYKAVKSGTVTTLAIQTGAVANTGVTSVTLGIYADNAGKPGAILGEGTFTGVPPVNSWVAVNLSVPVVSGTQYWLAEIPLGASFHFTKGGTVTTGQYYFVSGNTEPKLPPFNEATWTTESFGRGTFRATGSPFPALKGTHKLAANLEPLLANVAEGGAPVRDNFNRPNGGTGTNWKIPPGYDELVIENEQVRVKEGEADGSEVWHVEKFGNNQEAYVTRNVLGTEDVVSICMSYTEAGSFSENEWYYLSCNSTQAELVYLEKGGNFHSFGTEPVAWKPGDTMGLRRVGNFLYAFRISKGVVIPIGTPVEDTRITTGGYAGIYMLGTTARMDNFAAGNVKASIAANVSHKLTAKLEPKGLLIRQPVKNFAAKLTSTGSLTKAFNKPQRFSASLTPAGAVRKTFNLPRPFSASLTPKAATPNLGTTHKLTAALTSKGAVTLAPVKAFAANLAFLPTPAKFATAPVLDAFNRANEANIASSGKWTQSSGPIRLVSEKAVGQESGAYSEERIRTPFVESQEAYFTFPNTSGTKYGLSLRANSASVTETYYRATWSPSNKKVLIRHQGPSETVSLGEATIPYVAGDVMGFASIGSKLYVYRIHEGTFEIGLEVTDPNAGIYPYEGYIGLILEGAATEAQNFGGGPVSGTVVRQTQHPLKAEVYWGTGLLDNIIHPFHATVEFAGNTRREFNLVRVWKATMSFAGSLPKNVPVKLSASLSPSGSLTKQFNLPRVFRAALTMEANENRTPIIPFHATLSSAAQVGKEMTKPFKARVTFHGKVTPSFRGIIKWIGRVDPRQLRGGSEPSQKRGRSNPRQRTKSS